MVDNENYVSQNQQENIGFVKPSEHVELEENVKLELIDLFNFVYDYNLSHQINGIYCVGDVDNNDIVDPPNGSDAIHKYNIASTEYSSFNEMIDYLKNYMTVNIIYGSYYMDSENFIEKNGKLYCPVYDFGKGGVYEFQDAKIKYSKPYETIIYTTIETTLTYGDDEMHELFDVTFLKKNNKWVVSSYKFVSGV